VKRYSWEPWHFGFTAGGSVAAARASGEGGGDPGSPPAFVPDRWRDTLVRASAKWNVPVELLAAQLYAESNFNPFAQSPAGAQGLAQFTPGTARSYDLSNPFEPAASIDAQAHLMRDLLQRFATVPLALAAYNAGPATVAACSCIP